MKSIKAMSITFITSILSAIILSYLIVTINPQNPSYLLINITPFLMIFISLFTYEKVKGEPTIAGNIYSFIVSLIAEAFLTILLVPAFMLFYKEKGVTFTKIFSLINQEYFIYGILPSFLILSFVLIIAFSNTN